MHTIAKRGSGFGVEHFRVPIRVAAFRAFATLLLWQRRANERHALAQLDDRMLRDLGLSRSEVAEELRKPFWRA